MASEGLGLVEQVACLGCGCVCDDVDLVLRGARIAEARSACALGQAWFGDGTVPDRVRVAGADVSRDQGLDAAARLLADASRPLVYLAPDLSCEAQRLAIALADRLHAVIDSVTSTTAVSFQLAAQERGRAGATLGEIRNRADVVVFWGVDPALRYPRFSSRYAPDPVGLHLSGGRGSRTVVAVDVGAARGPADADVRVSLQPDEEVAVLTQLAAGVDGPGATHDLAAAFRSGRYLAIVADGESGATTDDESGRALALVALAQALNTSTRCALVVLRAGGNRSGGEASLTAQTGYPLAVDFWRGYPRYRPYDGTAVARLERGEVDAAVVIGAATQIPDDVRDWLLGVPCAVLGPLASQSLFASRHVVVDTGVAGIHEAGTALRMDDVPLPLRGAVPGPPGAAATVRALAARLRDSDGRGTLVSNG